MEIKFPRIYHLPWSEGLTTDDKKVGSDCIENFQQNDLVILEKMDGENTTMTKESIYARSLDSRDHVSRHWVKGLWSCINYKLGNLRLHGENVYAKHSVEYTDLDSYFFLFGVSEGNIYHSWDLVVEVAEWLHLSVAPVIKIMNGDFNQSVIPKFNSDKQEGYVVRRRDDFYFNQEDFNINIAKYVRANHVQTDTHWTHTAITRNRLRGE